MDTALATPAPTHTSETTEADGNKTENDADKDTAIKPGKTSDERLKKKSDVQKKAQRSRDRNQRLGKLGEELASVYLSENGFSIIERNWKCNSGEADIIANEEDTLVFIEVKTRSEAYPGLPEFAVTAERRARYEKIAISYLTKFKRPSGRVRFDVIAVRMTGGQQCLLRHHRDAFGAGE